MPDAAPRFSVKVERDNFDEVFQEYVKWNKRQPAEIVNSKIFFIARRAFNMTRRASPGAIRSDLAKPALYYTGLKLGEALAMAQHRKSDRNWPKKHRGGFEAWLKRQLPAWAERFQNNRVNRVGFLASGWEPAIRDLDMWQRKGDIAFPRRFMPRLEQRRTQKGLDKGGVKPAKLNQPIVVASIWNDAGAKGSERVLRFKQEAVDKAVIEEMRSMIVYINRKYSEQFDRMKRRSKGAI